MRMKVWGEISGERHLVGTLETIPGREEQFSYAESYLESEVAQPLSVRLPLREEPFPVRQTRAFFRNLLPEGGALAAVAKTLEVKSSSCLRKCWTARQRAIVHRPIFLESDNGSG
ncbi:MAG: HipA N-terminal domain-containing protein [Adlercreutzia equolifaciens]